MSAVILLIAFCVSLLVWHLRPDRAFTVYVISLLFYPVYLVVQLGPLDISLARIVVSVLLLRCLLNPKIKEKLVWHRLDSWLTFGAISSLCVAVAVWKLPISHYILFGAAFVMFLPMVYWLKHLNPKWKLYSKYLIVALAIGTLSSMSSGPVTMLLIF